MKNPDDPYAAVGLGPEAKQIEDAVRGRIDLWIDNRVSELHKELSKRVEIAGNDIVSGMQSHFDEITKEIADSLEVAAQQIATIKGLDPQDPGFNDAVVKLEAAITENKKAMAERREKFRKYGQLAGAIGKKALTSGI